MVRDFIQPFSDWYTNCILFINQRMKNILIAAVIVGAAGAGLILYLNKRNNNATPSNTIKDAATDAYKTMNAGIGKVERLGQHAMG